MEIFAYAFIGAGEQSDSNPRGDIENAGYRIAHWFADEAEPGICPRTRAHQFSAMLRCVGSGDTVMVARLRDLGCDAADILTTIQALKARQAAVIVLELDKIDLASDVGSMMLKVLNAVAELERYQSSAQEQSRSVSRHPRGTTCGRATVLSRELKAKIVTEYSEGTGMAELAQRYDVSRKRIQSIVDPRPKGDEVLPFAWGD